jgi:hypothetical protein
VASKRVSTSLRPVLILLPFRRLFLFHRLLFLALVFVFLAAFVSHRVILSYCHSSFKSARRFRFCCSSLPAKQFPLRELGRVLDTTSSQLDFALSNQTQPISGMSRNKTDYRQEKGGLFGLLPVSRGWFQCAVRDFLADREGMDSFHDDRRKPVPEMSDWHGLAENVSSTVVLACQAA